MKNPKFSEAKNKVQNEPVEGQIDPEHKPESNATDLPADSSYLCQNAGASGDCHEQDGGDIKNNILKADDMDFNDSDFDLFAASPLGAALRKLRSTTDPEKHSLTETLQMNIEQNKKFVEWRLSNKPLGKFQFFRRTGDEKKPVNMAPRLEFSDSTYSLSFGVGEIENTFFEIWHCDEQFQPDFPLYRLELETCMEGAFNHTERLRDNIEFNLGAEMRDGLVELQITLVLPKERRELLMISEPISDAPEKPKVKTATNGFFTSLWSVLTQQYDLVFSYFRFGFSFGGVLPMLLITLVSLYVGILVERNLQPKQDMVSSIPAYLETEQGNKQLKDVESGKSVELLPEAAEVPSKPPPLTETARKGPPGNAGECDCRKQNNPNESKESEPPILDVVEVMPNDTYVFDSLGVTDQIVPPVGYFGAYPFQPGPCLPEDFSALVDFSEPGEKTPNDGKDEKALDQ